MKRTVVLLAVGALLLSACASGSEAVGGTIEVTGTEYAFEGVPALVAPGAEFTFTNGGEEVHEMIIIKVVDGEARTLEEILALPEAESDALVAEFLGVVIDTPSGEPMNAEDGPAVITVNDPGRYAVVCFLPQGSRRSHLRGRNGRGRSERRGTAGARRRTPTRSPGDGRRVHGGSRQLT